MQPAFSVLMSVYAKDRPAWVRQALESVLSNTVQPTEIVIMVDGPIDKGLRAVLDLFAQNSLVHIINYPTNIGRGAALGYAVPKCTCNLIALMDADDVSRKDRFEKQLAVFAAVPNMSVVGGQIQEVDADTFAPLSQRKVPLTHDDIKQYLKTRMPFNNVTVMFKKDAVLAAGNYKAFGMLEDYYMWARVIALGYQTQNMPDVLVDVRTNGALYGRRGGYNYFHMNKLLFDKMRELNLISLLEYYYTLSVRFIVQVLMPNSVRSYFYKKALR